MLSGKNHKFFTSCGDAEAEMLLKRVLLEMKELLSGTDFCVVLGGSYGRGDGGVRQDRENGLLYNDLDFFVFARKKLCHGEKLLKEIAEKYEKELKVDVDFSRIMSIKDIKNNVRRLMMQELKRGYVLVYGEDLPEKFLPEKPAEDLPFSEACRLLLNRGMGLLFAGEKIMENSSDTDFILRNLYKGILGAVDSVLIAEGNYRWKIGERLQYINERPDFPEEWKRLYCEAVSFKHFPHRQGKENMLSFWMRCRALFLAAISRCAGGEEELAQQIYSRCCRKGEFSWKNFVKYCIKCRTLPAGNWKYYFVPPAAVLVKEIYEALNGQPGKIDRNAYLFRSWQLFN